LIDRLVSYSTSIVLGGKTMSISRHRARANSKHRRGVASTAEYGISPIQPGGPIWWISADAIKNRIMMPTDKHRKSKKTEYGAAHDSRSEFCSHNLE
jgi:hypothetical protein